MVKIISSFLFLGLLLSCAEEQFVSSSGAKKKAQPKPADANPAPPVDDIDPTKVITKTFEVSTRVKAEVTPQAAEQEAIITLTGGADYTETLKQVTRVPGTVRFDQGKPSVNQGETFRTDVSYGAIDILVVIDNSRSMQEEQANLATKLSSLLTSIDHSSWQVGIISTDDREACLRALIRKGDVDPYGTFSRTITSAGILGSGVEKGLLMGKRGLSCQPWLQSDSAVAVLIVSDEDNCSESCGGQDGVSGSLVSYLDSIRPPEQTAIYGIIDVPDAQGRSTCNTAYHVGDEYQSEIVRSGGVSGSICDGSYAKTLEAMSDKISKLLKKEYRLKQEPVAGTVKVTINGLPYSDFNVTGKTLTLGGSPSGDAEVKVSYDTRADTIKKSFDLGRSDIAEDGFRVVVNGVEQSSDSYAVQKSSLVFSSAPKEDAKIEVFYLLDQPKLKTAFTLGEEPLSENITVTINGENPKFSVDLASRTITFDEAPLDSVEISVTYPMASSPVLEYPVGDTEGHTFKSVVDADSGTPVNAVFDKGTLVFEKEAFKEGQKVKVTTSFMKEGSSVKLLSTPIEGSVEVLSTDCPEEPTLKVDGDSLIISCGNKNHKTTVGYEYENNRQETFDLGESPKEDSVVKVTINDQSTESFVVDGQTLKFSETLPAGATVKFVEIRASQAE